MKDTTRHLVTYRTKSGRKVSRTCYGRAAVEATKARILAAGGTILTINRDRR